jgi:hypothetical protein
MKEKKQPPPQQNQQKSANAPNDNSGKFLL